MPFENAFENRFDAINHLFIPRQSKRKNGISFSSNLIISAKNSRLYRLNAIINYCYNKLCQNTSTLLHTSVSRRQNLDQCHQTLAQVSPFNRQALRTGDEAENRHRHRGQPNYYRLLYALYNTSDTRLIIIHLNHKTSELRGNS